MGCKSIVIFHILIFKRIKPKLIKGLSYQGRMEIGACYRILEFFVFIFPKWWNWKRIEERPRNLNPSQIIYMYSYEKQKPNRLRIWAYRNQESGSNVCGDRLWWFNNNLTRHLIFRKAAYDLRPALYVIQVWHFAKWLTGLIVVCVCVASHIYVCP